MKTGYYNVGVCLLTSAESTLDRFEEPERRSAEKTSDQTNARYSKLTKSWKQIIWNGTKANYTNGTSMPNLLNYFNYKFDLQEVNTVCSSIYYRELVKFVANIFRT